MIYKYTMFGDNIVFDINSNSVYNFDNISYDLVDKVKKYNKSEIIDLFKNKYSKEEIEETLEEIDQLIDEGYLYSKSADVLPDFDKSSNVKALCLHVAHTCNLRCKYCFADEGKYNLSKILMDYETAKKSIDFVIKSSGNRKNIEIDFFGGEPLMNFDVVKETVSYARSLEKSKNKNFRFTITTNGLLLNEDNIKYLNENMSNIVLSIDGRKRIHDNMRIDTKNNGSYDKILSNFKKIAKLRDQKDYYVRGTFTRYNLDFSQDVIHLLNEGFKQISVEPVVSDSNSGFEIREKDIEKIFEEYEKLAKKYVSNCKKGKEFNFFHFMIDLDSGPCVLKRSSGCGAGFDYLAVSPDGDIYPCHQFVGKEEFKMGNVYKDSVNEKIENKFKNSNIYTKKDCDDCWAKFLCSGGCSANSYLFNKNIDIPYNISCKMQRKRLECALWIKTQIY
ncbi:MAG: thioether cross-link-forming SCIFF peptide maturase [Clostridiales bacterium]